MITLILADRHSRAKKAYVFPPMSFFFVAAGAYTGWANKNGATLHFPEYIDIYTTFAHTKADVYGICVVTQGLVLTLFNTVVPSGQS